MRCAAVPSALTTLNSWLNAAVKRGGETLEDVRPYRVVHVGVASDANYAHPFSNNAHIRAQAFLQLVQSRVLKHSESTNLSATPKVKT